MDTARSEIPIVNLKVVLLVTAGALLVVWLGAATQLDRIVLHWLARPEKQLRSDLLLLMRVWGSLWTWCLIALAASLLQHSPGRLMLWRPARALGLPLLLVPASAGALAELLKLLIRRKRPSELEVYLFRAWNEQPWSTKGLGLPSSHSAVAFAGSMALALLYPRLAWPALVVALGCGFTRIASGAHYPSDVVAGAMLGIITALALTPLRRTAR
jgi:membrane-associated phospholipid phosphatase